MKIEMVSGNIFESNADILVNPINTKAISGKGLAHEFAIKYPANQTHIKEECSKRRFKGGDIIFYLLDNDINPFGIINVCTKEDWRNPSKIEYVQKGIANIVDFVEYIEFLQQYKSKILDIADRVELVSYEKIKSLKTIAIPKLGSGLGGLKWKEVKPIIINSLESSTNDLTALIYE